MKKKNNSNLSSKYSQNDLLNRKKIDSFRIQSFFRKHL